MLKLFKSKLSEEDFRKKYFNKLREKVPGLKLISLSGLELRTMFDGQDEMHHLLDIRQSLHKIYENRPKGTNPMYILIEKCTTFSLKSVPLILS